MVQYPGITEYSAAVQRPAVAFADEQLKAGKLATNALGLPTVLGGGFALTYTVTSAGRKFAVRCFHRYVPDLEQRYALISEGISRLRSPHFVSFEYQREGIRLKSGPFPIVKMAWAEGRTLGAVLEACHDNKLVLKALTQKFRELARFLGARRIAHGDLENSNIVVPNGPLTLIDYDGMYVPSMPLGNGNELGHTHFQHPGRQPDHFGPRIDDFSFILIDVSLQALIADKSLYEQFSNGDNIIFQESDFRDSSSSAVFRHLRTIPDLANRVEDFATVCTQPIEKVPSFEIFVRRHRPAGRNIDYFQKAVGPQESASQNALSPSRAQRPVARRPVTATLGGVVARHAAPRLLMRLNWPWWAETAIAVLILFGFLALRG